MSISSARRTEMLDEIPRSMWIWGWFRRNKDRLITASFWILGIATIAAYYPVRQYLVQEEWRVVVYASNLTVPLLALVSLVGWLFGKAIDKRWLKGKSWVLRQVAWLGCVAVLFTYLKFMGVGMRF